MIRAHSSIKASKIFYLLKIQYLNLLLKSLDSKFQVQSALLLISHHSPFNHYSSHEGLLLLSSSSGQLPGLFLCTPPCLEGSSPRFLQVLVPSQGSVQTLPFQRGLPWPFCRKWHPSYPITPNKSSFFLFSTSFPSPKWILSSFIVLYLSLPNWGGGCVLFTPWVQH